ncbi:hypothetical protein Enr13x_65740 [Stieleria neptunia]|uniref:Uncharacterized protein n=1 Tax=Stieleria neptunia TaxID=2527979 RepID=A0A518I0M6_9BACT|nr:hypothetical protein Enr13x_65740 [Stieleria neptunia]
MQDLATDLDSLPLGETAFAQQANAREGRRLAEILATSATINSATFRRHLGESSAPEEWVLCMTWGSPLSGKVNTAIHRSTLPSLRSTLPHTGG